MANPHRGEITVTLGDDDKKRDYIVRIGNNEVCEMEAGLQLPITAWGQGGFRLIREGLFHGLEQDTRRRMTRQQISKILEESDMEHVATQVGKAIKAGMPDDDEDTETVKGAKEQPPLAPVPGAKVAG